MKTRTRSAFLIFFATAFMALEIWAIDVVAESMDAKYGDGSQLFWVGMLCGAALVWSLSDDK